MIVGIEAITSFSLITPGGSCSVFTPPIHTSLIHSEYTETYRSHKLLVECLGGIKRILPSESLVVPVLRVSGLGQVCRNGCLSV